MRYAHSPLLTQKRGTRGEVLVVWKAIFIFAGASSDITRSRAESYGKRTRKAKKSLRKGDRAVIVLLFLPPSIRQAPFPLPLPPPHPQQGAKQQATPTTSQAPPLLTPPFLSGQPSFSIQVVGGGERGGMGLPACFVLADAEGEARPPFPLPPPPLWLASNTTSKQAAS